MQNTFLLIEMRTPEIRNILYSPYFLALLLTIIVILFLPDMFSKYKVEQIKRGKTDNIDEIDYYYDLDGDGNSEKIESFISGQDHYCIQVFAPGGGIIDQWNFTHKLPGLGDRLIAGDYDGDGQKEIYTLSQQQDSLFLYGVIPVENGRYFIKRRFITTLNSVDNKIEYSITNFNLVDLNRDSLKELIFVIHSGFSLQPRAIYSYCINEDSLIMSPPCASIIGDIKFFDLNEDGYPEIIGGMGAAGNIRDTSGIPYSDYSAWLMVFDHNLNYLFEPKEFPGFHSNLSVQPYYRNGKRAILTFYNHTGSRDNYPVLLLYNYKGDVITQHKFPKSPKYEASLIKDSKSGYWIINDRGEARKIGKDLQIVKTLNFETEIFRKPLILDIDGDTKPEYIFKKRNSQNGIVFREGFTKPVEFELPGGLGTNSHSIIETAGKPPQLYLQKGNNFAIYKYGYNYLYPLRYPVYLGIYLAVLLIILLIRKLQQMQIRDKLLLQNRISELQLKTINNQLNPHFILNAFNSIASLLKREKGDVAYNYFIKFSNLVKSNLLSADQISRTIEEELSMVTDYLDIQILRFENRFKYEIEVDKDVDPKWKIPKMTIQNYIENAVKHGLKHKQSGGLLKINIERKNNHISIQITDNGIGRAEASKLNSGSTGMGMQVMDHYFSLLNKYNSVKIRQQITDLYDENGNPAGTKVEVEIPVNIKYNIARV